MIRGIIFDMDGTLTEPHIDFQALRRELGVMVGDIVDHLKSVDDAERRRLESILHRIEEDAAVNATLQPGAAELLDALRARGIKLGLLTRNTRKSVKTVLAKFGLRFDATLTREDGPHKPSPEPVLALARRWHLPPAEMLVVGDYLYDLRCARDAGARGVLLINDNVPEWAHEADFIIHDLSELTDVLERIP
ncbi:MAG: HAD family hydrolase [Verrucomicrobia bacterium]|nr:HAD family hydrolase [Verrucomicrobiota bacterium]